MTPPVSFFTEDAMRTIFSNLRQLHEKMILTFDADASELWQQFYQRHAIRQYEAEGAEAGMLAKMEAVAARLAAVLQVAKESLPGVERTDFIDKDSMAGGITLAEWYSAEWERLFNSHIAPADDPDESLLDLVTRRGGKVKRTTIMQAIRRFRRAEVIDAALAKYAEAGLLRVEAVRDGDRGPKTEWVVLTG